MRLLNPLVLAFAAAVILAAMLTPAVRRLALMLGAVDLPGGRKSHHGPVPRLGGMAVVLAVFISAAVVAGAFPALTLAIRDGRPLWLVVALGSLLLLIVGAVDDVRGVRASMKLGAEFLAAVAVVAMMPLSVIDLGLFEISGAWLVPGLVAVWIVAVTNAYNMIDGLDGLASGIGAIAASTMAVGAWQLGFPLPAVVLLALAGALTAFLIHNGQPARIFLGDSGSLPIGFLLATLGIVGFRQGDAWMALPAVIALGVPQMDLVVTVIRRFLERLRVVRQDLGRERFQLHMDHAPRWFSADGRHLHHRLLAIGLTRRQTVFALYAAGFGLGVLSLTSIQWQAVAMIAIVMILVGLSYVGSQWLYDELRIFRRGVLLPLFDLPILHHRRVHALFDFTAFGAAYVIARWMILLANGSGAPLWSGAVAIRAGLTGVIAVAIIWLGGVYEASLRHAGMWVFLRSMRAVLIASMAGLAAEVFLFGARVDIPRWVMVTYLAGTFIIASRMSFQVLDAIHQRARSSGRRVVIYGAGRGGRAVVRELLSNSTISLIPAGFVDDDPTTWHKTLEGFPVYPGGAVVTNSLTTLGADALVVSSTKVSTERLAELAQICYLRGIRLMRMRISVDEHLDEPMAAPLATAKEMPMVRVV